MKLLERLIDAPDGAQGPGVEQMAFRGLKIRPALLQVFQRRERLGQTIATELGLRLAQRIDGIVAQRQLQDVIVVTFGLVETLDPQTLGGKRNAVGDGVGGGETVGQFTIQLFRIEPVGNAAPCLLGTRPAQHLRYQFNH
jgi:hypothetical protein